MYMCSVQVSYNKPYMCICSSLACVQAFCVVRLRIVYFVVVMSVGCKDYLCPIATLYFEDSQILCTQKFSP